MTERKNDDNKGAAQDFQSEVRKQAVSQAAKWTLWAVGGLVALSAAGWWIVLDREISDYIRRNAGTSIPPGAVVAFTIPCPTELGWSTHTDSYARMIVGAIPNGGKPSEMLHSVENHQNYYAGERHGDERVTLTKGEMPNHTHQLSTAQGDNWHDGLAGIVAGEPPNQAAGIHYKFDPTPRDGGHGPVPEALEYVGGNQPHNNMPPYIALYYCKKD